MYFTVGEIVALASEVQLQKAPCGTIGGILDVVSLLLFTYHQKGGYGG
jgi:hypothetical protein